MAFPTDVDVTAQPRSSNHCDISTFGRRDFSFHIIMPQTLLSFAASKRTSSTAQIAKSKLRNVVTVTNSPPKSPRKRQRNPNSDDESTDNNDEIETPGISEDDKESIEEVASSVEEELTKEVVAEVVTPKTRSQTQAANKVSTNQKITSASPKPKENGTSASPMPFKPSNLTSEDLLKKVETNTSKEKSSEPQDLNPKSPKWNKIYGATKEKMGWVPTSTFVCSSPIIPP